MNIKPTFNLSMQNHCRSTVPLNGVTALTA